MNAPITAETDAGNASFQRVEKDTVKLKISYTIPDCEMPMAQGNVKQSIESLCQAEIEFMRNSLAAVGEGLARQLNGEGRRPTLERSWEDDDERTWRNRKNSFAIDTTNYASEEIVTHANGVSDAALVHEVIAQLINQRTQAIRSVYRNVLISVLQMRDSSQG